MEALLTCVSHAQKPFDFSYLSQYTYVVPGTEVYLVCVNAHPFHCSSLNFADRSGLGSHGRIRLRPLPTCCRAERATLPSTQKPGGEFTPLSSKGPQKKNVRPGNRVNRQDRERVQFLAHRCDRYPDTPQTAPHAFIRRVTFGVRPSLRSGPPNEGSLPSTRRADQRYPFRLEHPGRPCRPSGCR